MKNDVAIIGAGAQRVGGKKFNKNNLLHSKNFKLLSQIKEKSTYDDCFFKYVISVRGICYD
jgi:hypothetical protein